MKMTSRRTEALFAELVNVPDKMQLDEAGNGYTV